MTVMKVVERNRNQSLQASTENMVWSVFILHAKYELLSEVGSNELHLLRYIYLSKFLKKLYF